MSAPARIGVDWGTTNLRAFSYDDEGGVREARRSATGEATIKPGGFETALLKTIGDWVKGGTARVIISGMAGSREGWVEAPYAPCPANFAAHATALVRAPATFGEVWLAPGVFIERRDGMIDVMRGEETQIFGAALPADGVAILPGTHSKWARIVGGAIVDIRSFMTGELFALLKDKSILGRLMQGDAHDETAFKLGVQRALNAQRPLNLLFSARTEGLFKHVTPEALPGYLSGMLIGTEIAEAKACGAFAEAAPAALIGAQEISARYESALMLAGLDNVARHDGENAAARGLWRLMQARSEA